MYYYFLFFIFLLYVRISAVYKDFCFKNVQRKCNFGSCIVIKDKITFKMIIMITHAYHDRVFDAVPSADEQTASGD